MYVGLSIDAFVVTIPKCSGGKRQGSRFPRALNIVTQTNRERQGCTFHEALHIMRWHHDSSAALVLWRLQHLLPQPMCNEFTHTLKLLH